MDFSKNEVSSKKEKLSAKKTILGEQKLSKTEMRLKLRTSGSKAIFERKIEVNSDNLDYSDNVEADSSGSNDYEVDYHEESSHDEDEYFERKEGFCESETNDKKVIKRKLFSSELDCWKPVELITNTCFDNGTLLSKEICDTNLKKVFKSKKHIDYYEVLKRSDSDIAKTVALLVFQVNKLTNKSDGKEKEEKKTRSSVFNLEASREVSREVSLPGGKRLILSMLIDNVMCSKWVGTNVVSKAAVSVLDEARSKRSYWNKCLHFQICSRDRWFLMYAAPATSRATRYFRIDSDFFELFAKTLATGFELSMESRMMSNLIDNVTTITRNYIDKKRGMLKDECAVLYPEFSTLYQENFNFRQKECLLHDDIQKVHSQMRKYTPKRISKYSDHPGYSDNVTESRDKPLNTSEFELPLEKEETSYSKNSDSSSLRGNVNNAAKNGKNETKDDERKMKRKMMQDVKQVDHETPKRPPRPHASLDSIDKSPMKSSLQRKCSSSITEDGNAKKRNDNLKNDRLHSKEINQEFAVSSAAEQVSKRARRTYKPVRKFLE